MALTQSSSWLTEGSALNPYSGFPLWISQPGITDLDYTLQRSLIPQMMLLKVSHSCKICLAKSWPAVFPSSPCPQGEHLAKQSLLHTLSSVLGTLFLVFSKTKMLWRHWKMRGVLAAVFERKSGWEVSV